MRIGGLDRYVLVEQKITTNDPDLGAETVSWVEYKKAWASIMDITTRSQESTNSDLRQLKQPCRIKMRYDKNINSNMRIVVLDDDERILQIVSQPAELGRREAIEFMAENYNDVPTYDETNAQFYLSIQDNNLTPANSLDAVFSDDLGNNTGWVFRNVRDSN